MLKRLIRLRTVSGFFGGGVKKTSAGLAGKAGQEVKMVQSIHIACSQFSFYKHVRLIQLIHRFPES